MAISLSSAISGKREPKRGNRWILKFETVPYNLNTGPAIGAAELSNGASDPSESLAIDLLSASRPTINFNMSEISRLNEKWKFASNPTWEPITVVFYDFDSGQGSAAQIMWRWAQTVYDVLNGTMGYAATYKVDASLILLGPGQTSTNKASSTDIEIIEAWDLFGCFPNNMAAGELSYETSDALRISTEIQFDFANLHTQADTGGAGGTWKSIA
jgi:hypothetical protein